MKNKLAVSSLAGMLLLALALPSFAAEKGKQVTIIGEAKCAKCALKESDKCQNVIETTKADGTKVKY